ncbi:MAG TPA: zinc ribbon domain-containing protein [Candidatus Binatia bacterium]|nr:zinc ribbon domain-containing protein [Candidatus Binatia bacterium]
MTMATTCESCGMPLTTAADHARGDETIPYCVHCTTESGELQSFDERLERMTQWAMRSDGLDRPTAHARTLQHMRSMPAWRDHPALSGR